MEGVRLVGTQAKARTTKYQAELSCVEPALAQFNMEDLGHLVLSLIATGVSFQLGDICHSRLC